jgi:hypothetical protein
MADPARQQALDPLPLVVTQRVSPHSPAAPRIAGIL